MKMFNKIKPKKLVTHDGSFHTDDIFACAVLSLMLEKNGEEFEIIRTRDPEIIKTGDYVFDIGYVYDPSADKFDHHQPGGAGNRSFGDVKIEYSSFGLVWKKFGIELCGDKNAVNLIDRKLVASVDAHDNGFDLITNNYEISPYFIQNIFYSMRPTWKEKDLKEDEMFLKCLEIAKTVLAREIIQAQDQILAEELVTLSYKNSLDKRIVILDDKYPFDYILNGFPEPLFAIYPRKMTQDWGVKAIREDPKMFKNRKDFPAIWGGLRDEELQKISGVLDAIFCHRGLFMAVAKSKEGAIKLAELALKD